LKEAQSSAPLFFLFKKICGGAENEEADSSSGSCSGGKLSGLAGGVTGAYLYTTNEGSTDAQDGFRITNAVVNLKGSSGSMGFDLAVGSLLAPTVWSNVSNSMISYTTGNVTSNEAGLLWGYVSFSPVERITLDAGLLTTNVGYEVVNTYANPNINLGLCGVQQRYAQHQRGSLRCRFPGIGRGNRLRR